jgi:hypothetical protein
MAVVFKMRKLVVLCPLTNTKPNEMLKHETLHKDDGVATILLVWWGPDTRKIPSRHWHNHLLVLVHYSFCHVAHSKLPHVHSQPSCTLQPYHCWQPFLHIVTVPCSMTFMLCSKYVHYHYIDKQSPESYFTHIQIFSHVCMCKILFIFPHNLHAILDYIQNFYQHTNTGN